MKPTWRPTEKRRLLIEINIDAAKENGCVVALIFLIQCEREIKRHHLHGVAHFSESRNERVIAETVSAIHRPSARSDLENGHFGSIDWLRISRRCFLRLVCCLGSRKQRLAN